MINENSIEFYNTRLTFDYAKVKDLTPAQKDRIRNYGSQAESLMKNKDLAMFIHHFKFEVADQLAGIRGHSPEDNLQRTASYHLEEAFDIRLLQDQTYYLR